MGLRVRLGVTPGGAAWVEGQVRGLGMGPEATGCGGYRAGTDLATVQ